MKERPWFPRPECPSDLHLVGPEGLLDSETAFSMMREGGDEWRSKVGVAGPLDGSAKATTRLLHQQGWVFKTNMSWLISCEEEVLQRAESAGASERALGLWHPSKQWLALRVARGWLPVSACQRLDTLRAVEGIEAKLAAFQELVALSVKAFRDHQVGLDMNPANFGREQPEGRMWYIDDETYGTLGLIDLASFLVARIPEEPTIEEDAWHRWGVVLQSTLSGVCATPAQWVGLVQALHDYPLHETFHTRRARLTEGLLHENAGTKRKPRPRLAHQLTCVLADVHGNEPALEAVLAAARADGADGYLFVGDAVGYGPHPGECVRRLAELPNAIHIRGNHDNAIGSGRWENGANHHARECAGFTRDALSAAELSWLRELPTDHQEDDWIAVHGAPKDPHRFLAYVYELTYEENMDVVRKAGLTLCFYGHTHVQYVHRCLLGHTAKAGAPPTIKTAPKQQLLVNPGSVGQPRDGLRSAAYAIWDRRSGEIHLRRAEYDMERTLVDLRRVGLSTALSDRLMAGR